MVGKGDAFMALAAAWPLLTASSQRLSLVPSLDGSIVYHQDPFLPERGLMPL
jgi:hypothetical protein